jgi:hypothetical protein
VHSLACLGEQEESEGEELASFPKFQSSILRTIGHELREFVSNSTKRKKKATTTQRKGEYQQRSRKPHQPFLHQPQEYQSPPWQSKKIASATSDSIHEFDGGALSVYSSIEQPSAHRTSSIEKKKWTHKEQNNPDELVSRDSLHTGFVETSPHSLFPWTLFFPQLSLAVVGWFKTKHF